MIIETELGGKTRKHKGNSKEKDCLTKRLILETISVSPLTAREIYERSGYTGTYKTLTGIIGRYQRFGYIAREGKIPYHYYLTDLGFQHLENPFLGRENAVRAYKSRLVEALVKYADSLDDETVTRIFKDRVIPPTLIKPPDKVTVKSVNENIKVIDSKPAMPSPKPSEGFSGSFDASASDDKDHIIAEQAETIKEQADMIAELRKTPMSLKVPKSEPVAPVNDEHKHDALILAYRNKVVDKAFFNKMHRALYEFTSVNTKHLAKAVLDILKTNLLKKGDIIYVSFSEGGTLEKYGVARRLTDDEIKTYKPNLQFGSGDVVLSIRYKKQTYQFFICEESRLKRQTKAVIKPLKDVPHSKH